MLGFAYKTAEIKLSDLFREPLLRGKEALGTTAVFATLGAAFFLGSELVDSNCKDAIRLKVLDNLSQAINVSLQEATSSARLILCSDSDMYPCSGSSHTGTRLTNGSGWIKANLTSQISVTLSTLFIIRT